MRQHHEDVRVAAQNFATCQDLDQNVQIVFWVDLIVCCPSLKQRQYHRSQFSTHHDEFRFVEMAELRRMQCPEFRQQLLMLHLTQRNRRNSGVKR